MLTEIIHKSLQKSFSYSEYKNLIDSLVTQKKTTGQDQSEALVQFTQLNYQRMKRLDKTLKINQEDQEKLKKFSNKLTWIVITEAWCGDAAQIVPVIHKIAEINPNFDLRLVLRDQNEPLMNEFLTHGAKAIPILIIIDKQTSEVLHVWGSRPKIASQIVQECKAKYGKLTPECKEELQKWYNKDKGQSIVNEIINILNIY